MRAAIMLVLVGVTLGCSEGDDETTVPAGCAAGEWPREDGSCAPAGLPPDVPCAPGEWQRDGMCVPAGIPSDGCGQGFVHDGDGGCDPILPASRCTAGLMAVPGERSCREVAPCAPGTWGDIPIEPNTEHVDVDYAGLDSDGSALKPWTTIQDAIDAAAPAAIVAIAAGSYVEDITVSGKPVRLWGVCPELVEVVGTGTEPAALIVFMGANGTAVQSLAFRGSAVGIGVAGSLDVSFERIWVHGTAGRGIVVEGWNGPTRVTLRESLVEDSYELGVVVTESEATVETSAVRATRLDAQGNAGRGVGAFAFPATGAPATLQLLGSVVEDNHDAGVFVEGSHASVDATVVRGTQTELDNLFGRGVSVVSQRTTGAPARLELRTSIVEQNHELGMFIEGSEAIIDSTVVRDTQPNGFGELGRGIEAQSNLMTGAPSLVQLRTSLIARNHQAGVFLAGSEATVEGSVVRGTQLDPEGLEGRGIVAQHHETTGAPSKLHLRDSLVHQNPSIGVSIAGSQLTVEGSVIRETYSNALGLLGRGINVQAHTTTGAPSTFALVRSIVEQSGEAGVFIAGSLATIDASIVRDTVSNAAGDFGGGIVSLAFPGVATAHITATRVERSALAAIAAWGAQVSIGGSVLSCQTFDLDTETYEGTPAVLDDLGQNLCGCPASTPSCKAVTANLQPPTPLD